MNEEKVVDISSVAEALMEVIAEIDTSKAKSLNELKELTSTVNAGLSYMNQKSREEYFDLMSQFIGASIINLINIVRESDFDVCMLGLYADGLAVKFMK